LVIIYNLYISNRISITLVTRRNTFVQSTIYQSLRDGGCCSGNNNYGSSRRRQPIVITFDSSSSSSSTKVVKLSMPPPRPRAYQYNKLRSGSSESESSLHKYPDINYWYWMKVGAMKRPRRGHPQHIHSYPPLNIMVVH